MPKHKMRKPNIKVFFGITSPLIRFPHTNSKITPLFRAWRCVANGGAGPWPVSVDVMTRFVSPPGKVKDASHPASARDESFRVRSGHTVSTKFQIPEFRVG